MVGFLESDNWNSGVEETAEEGDVVMLVVLEGVGVMTSSRHCGVGFRPAIAGGVLTDWKAWIGRASKNSCANMNGVFDGSGDSDCTYLDRELGRWAYHSVQSVCLRTIRWEDSNICSCYETQFQSFQEVHLHIKAFAGFRGACDLLRSGRFAR